MSMIMPPPRMTDEDLQRLLMLRLLSSFPGDPIGHQVVTVDATQKPLQPPAEAQSAVVSVETADVRMTVDGQAPAAGVGNGRLVVAGSSVTLTGLYTLTVVLFTRNGGISATLWVDYFN